jgi:hypothetical protein
MLGFFWPIYVVSPGDQNFTRSPFKEFCEIYPAFAHSLIIFAAILMRFKTGKSKNLGYWLQILTLVYFGVTLKNNSLGLLEKTVQMYHKQELGLIGYQRHPEWSEALEWDKKMPPASRGAIIHAKRFYFTPNYMLFPRILYPTEPSVIAGTYRDWPAWKSASEVPTQRLSLAFIVDGEKNEVLIQKPAMDQPGPEGPGDRRSGRGLDPVPLIRREPTPG